jgi:asparagine synthase (glutamine-hydrolysing)
MPRMVFRSLLPRRWARWGPSLNDMCGICGAIGEARGELAEPRVRCMLAGMVHRGPDDEGLLTKPGAVLGMRRLSIIDLAGGHQPVFNEDGTVGVVFNGEIYNFSHLRASLESRGHRFRTRSDTEVIVHAYEEWGERCLTHLRGMFALALWDGRAGSGQGGSRVLLARDRLGIKPLYYAAADGALLFASEVRSLLASGAVARRLARESIEAYLLFGSVAEPMTLVQGVFSLPPGHALMVSCRDAQKSKPAAYWDLAEAACELRKSDLPQTLPAAAQAVRPLLEEAVRSHLVADVPLGLFLSSGLDSTALVALASREHSGLHTFTIVFPEQEFSEAEIARRTAERFGTEHRELMVTGEQMLERLPQAIGALDQPSMDGINTYFVSWAARQAGLKVALSGLGGDEVFGGYPTFRLTPRVAAVAALARLFPATLRRTMSEALLAVGRNGRASARTDALRKLGAIWSGPDSLPHPYFFTRLLFTAQQIQFLSTRRKAVAPSLWSAWLEQAAAGARELGGDAGVSSLEMRAYMVNTLLRDTDSTSMRHSLEVRVPLLDHPLVEFVTALPDRARQGRGLSKALLVEALGSLVPREVVEQPKRTFTFPWRRWLRGPLGLEVAMRLGAITPSLAEVLDREEVHSVWRSFLMGRAGWARPWSLFVLNEWVRCHLDQKSAPVEQQHPVAALAPGA